MIIVAAHFIIGIGLLVYKIHNAGKNSDKQSYDSEDWAEPKCGDE